MPLNPASSAPKPPFIILIGLCVQTESCQDKTGSYLGPTPLFWPPSLDGGPGGRRDEERRACVCCTSQSLVVPPHLNEPARLCYHNPFSLSSSWTRTNIHTHTLMTAVFGQVNVCCIAPSPLALSPSARQNHPTHQLLFRNTHPPQLPTATSRAHAYILPGSCRHISAAPESPTSFRTLRGPLKLANMDW